MEDATIHSPPARLVLFGHPATSAHVELLSRSKSWRLRRALLTLGAGIAAAPLVALVPPHIPWVVTALAAGAYLGWQRWTEHYTLVSFSGRCPRCDAEVDVPPGRISVPGSATCMNCHQTLRLEIDVIDTGRAGDEP